jgi:hypothetical protein
LELKIAESTMEDLKLGNTFLDTYKKGNSVILYKKEAIMSAMDI